MDAYSAGVVPGFSTVGTTTVLETRVALCEYCGTHWRCDGGTAKDSDGRASGASRGPDCGLSAGFDDNSGNADGAGDARG